eukprot:109326_1
MATKVDQNPQFHIELFECRFISDAVQSSFQCALVFTKLSVTMEKRDIQQMMIGMGFQASYLERAFKVYEKNYGHSYNVEVITEIVVRLQNKDMMSRNNEKRVFLYDTIGKLNWKWIDFEASGHSGANSFYMCIAQEIYGKHSAEIEQKVSRDVYDYITQDPDTLEYFQEMYRKYDDPSAVRADLSRDSDLFLNTMQQKTIIYNVHILAASELYNVRIVLFEYLKSKSKVCLSKFKSYVSCIDIPVIIMANLKRASQWAIIRDVHDIVGLMELPEYLEDYGETITNIKPKETVVDMLCNHWTNHLFPSEISQLVVQFMPSLNLRPIQGSNDAKQQMKNRRNEIQSHIKE